jgi:hypothetical protein
MQVIQNRDTQIFRGVSGEITDIWSGCVSTKVIFSDGSEIYKSKNKGYWDCLFFNKNGFLEQLEILDSELINYLPKEAADDLIYNLDTFITL